MTASSTKGNKNLMSHPKTVSPATKMHSWRAIFATTATIGTVGTAIGFGAPLISAMMTAHDISNSIIGYNGMTGGIATVIAAACTSRIALRFGVVRPILAMLIVGALSFLGFYCFQALWTWFVLRFTLHFAMTIMFILSEFWVNSSAPSSKRGFVLAVYATTLGLGFAIGPILFSMVGSNGFLPFGIGCAITALASIPIIAAWKLSPQFRDSAHVPFLHYIFKVKTSTLAVFVFGAIQMGAITLITPFSLNAGYSEMQAGQFMTLLALGSVLLLVPISIISDRICDRRYSLAGCALTGLAGALIVPFILDNRFLLKGDLFLLGGVSAGLYTIGLAQLGAHLKGHELAAANSAFIFCYGIGMLIGPAMIGLAMDTFPTLGFSASIAAFFGLYVILVVLQLTRKLFCS